MTSRAPAIQPLPGRSEQRSQSSAASGSAALPRASLSLRPERVAPSHSPAGQVYEILAAPTQPSRLPPAPASPRSSNSAYSQSSAEPGAALPPTQAGAALIDRAGYPLAAPQAQLHPSYKPLRSQSASPPMGLRRPSSSSEEPVMRNSLDAGRSGGRQTPVSQLSSSNGKDKRRSVQATDLALPLATLEDLEVQRTAANTSGDMLLRVKWARALLRYLERTQSESSISDRKLIRWCEEAIGIITTAATSMPPIAEALYLQADLHMSGTFPSLVAKNPREGFRGFEAAANAEFATAWYRIGREYEAFSDFARAKDSFEKGVKLGDPTSTYRLGMAYLLGQMGLPADVAKGLGMLRKAALISDRIADPDMAAPLYVYGLLLIGEFEAGEALSSAQMPKDPVQGSRMLKRAAYLGHIGAQHRLGQVFEYAQLGEDFDPVMSLQYFSLASQQGDAESDLALSKWFLCGAEGYFQPNEHLAFTFAEKAGTKGLSSGQFALGYYYELGIGCMRDIAQAKRWYTTASNAGNDDARGRLAVLSAGAGSLSRAEHEQLTDSRLTRRHSLAQQKSDQRNKGRAPKAQLTIDTAMTNVKEAAQSPKPVIIKPAKQVSQSNARSNQPRRAETHQTSYHSTSMPMHSPVKPSTGPQTFEEMGVQATRLKKEECVIQ